MSTSASSNVTSLRPAGRSAAGFWCETTNRIVASPPSAIIGCTKVLVTVG